MDLAPHGSTRERPPRTSDECLADEPCLASVATTQRTLRRMRSRNCLSCFAEGPRPTSRCTPESSRRRAPKPYTQWHLRHHLFVTTESYDDGLSEATFDRSSIRASACSQARTPHSRSQHEVIPPSFLVVCARRGDGWLVTLTSIDHETSTWPRVISPDSIRNFGSIPRHQDLSSTLALDMRVSASQEGFDSVRSDASSRPTCRAELEVATTWMRRPPKLLLSVRAPPVVMSSLLLVLALRSPAISSGGSFLLEQ